MWVDKKIQEALRVLLRMSKSGEPISSLNIKFRHLEKLLKLKALLMAESK